jgi:hypothetical protein
MVNASIAGRPLRDVLHCMDKVERTYRVARVLARNTADEEFIVNVVALDEAADAGLLALVNVQALALSGTPALKVWTDEQSIASPSLDLVGVRATTAQAAAQQPVASD